MRSFRHHRKVGPSTPHAPPNAGACLLNRWCPSSFAGSVVNLAPVLPLQQRPIEFTYSDDGGLTWEGQGMLRKQQSVNVVSDVKKVRMCSQPLCREIYCAEFWPRDWSFLNPAVRSQQEMPPVGISQFFCDDCILLFFRVCRFISGAIARNGTHGGIFGAPSVRSSSA